MTGIKEYCSENLEEIAALISNLSPAEYTAPISNLSQSSIGQHVRHIVEFYICLNDGISNKTVDYDSRRRDLRLEQNPEFTLNALAEMKYALSGFTETLLELKGNYSAQEVDPLKITTSLSRELAYCLEHSIHHQALIKVALLELGIAHKIDAHFGVAPATIRYREEIAQG